MFGATLLSVFVVIAVLRAWQWAKRQDKLEAKSTNVHPSLVKEMRQFAAKVSRLYDEPKEGKKE